MTWIRKNRVGRHLVDRVPAWHTVVAAVMVTMATVAVEMLLPLVAQFVGVGDRAIVSGGRAVVHRVRESTNFSERQGRVDGQ